MKHTTLRSTVLAVAAACAAPVFAQSNVTVYGVADMYLQFGKGDGTTTRLESGGLSGSRLGFKGQEDLGNGLKALFQIESGIAMDNGGVTQGGVFWGRQAFVGLSSATLGTLQLGRQYNLAFVAIDGADPFGTGLGSVFSSGIVSAIGGARINNAAVYTSPKLGPVTFSLLAAPGEGATGRQFAGEAKYAGGPLTVDLALVRKNGFGAAPANASSALLTAIYDFGSFKLMGEVQSVKNLTQLAATNDDRIEYFGGVQVPFGPHMLSAVIGSGKTKNVANTRATEFSLGYDYALSKRTDLYVIGSAINNGSATAFTANGATGSGPLVSAGNDVRALQLGIRHRF